MKLICIISIFLLICSSLNAQTFTSGEHDGLKYQALSSSLDEDIRPALVIFLHGGHARGDDNQAQINLPAVQDIAAYIVYNRISAHFLVPQCPADHEWVYIFAASNKPNFPGEIFHQTYPTAVKGHYPLRGHCIPSCLTIQVSRSLTYRQPHRK